MSGYNQGNAPHPSGDASLPPAIMHPQQTLTPAMVGGPGSFYTHRERATMAADFINNLFPRAKQTHNWPLSSQSSSPAQPPDLPHFIAYALYLTRRPDWVLFAALLLLSRLAGVRASGGQGHSAYELFITAYMVSSGMLCDDTFSTGSWCIAAQNLFSERELNAFTRDFCCDLKWKLNATPEELATFKESVLTTYQQRQLATRQ